jgi:oxygen-dependent protoporphyrinogen oxidase
MTACSVGSAKWPQWSVPHHTVLRVSAGRAGDDRAMELDDHELVARLSDETAQALGATAPPTAVRISRWPAGFPQYRVGHFERLAAIEAALASDLPGVALAGASFRGVGIPACIASGEAAALVALGHARGQQPGGSRAIVAGSDGYSVARDGYADAEDGTGAGGA